MFFNYGTSNFNVSARITIATQYNHKTKVPEAITNIICLSFSELENGVFLDLVLLRFTPVTSYSFSCPSWRSSFTATLSCTCFWIFLPSGIQSGEETDVGTFILLLFEGGVRGVQIPQYRTWWRENTVIPHQNLAKYRNRSYKWEKVDVDTTTNPSFK